VHVALVTVRDRNAFSDLTRALETAKVSWRHVPSVDPAVIFAEGDPDGLVLDMAGPLARHATVRAITEAAHRDRLVPVLALIPRADLTTMDPALGLDDFALMPLDVEEVVARLQLLNARYKGADLQGDVLQLGDLRIDLSRYEVWVGPRQVTLTFKEYELLRLLASEPGRVFTREVLLDRVWGYDYFGGTRTVDVHVRRLRSKLEDPVHTFIETVRNVGYRLKLIPTPAAGR
jgi:DNA-binding response OmpR family regulator